MAFNRKIVIAAAASVALFGAACSSDDTTTDATTTPPAEPTAAETMPDMTTPEETAAADPAANLVGPGCAGYAETVPSGAGSVEGMAMDPVATAASNNPLLTTLTAAVSGQVNPDVDLVDTLNGGEFTVFAPVDDAFAQIDDETMAALQTDADLLSDILTYHVVSGQAWPDEVVGEHETVQGETLTVTGSGDNLQVNGANVICGGVQTANAVVYLVDAVLLPPAAE